MRQESRIWNGKQYTQKKTLSKDSVSRLVVEELLDPLFSREILAFLSSISFLKDILRRLKGQNTCYFKNEIRSPMNTELLAPEYKSKKRRWKKKWRWSSNCIITILSSYKMTVWIWSKISSQLIRSRIK